MVDELDFKKEESHFFEKRGELIKRNFAKRNIEVSLMNDTESVYKFIDSFIQDRPYIKHISFSDGVTLYQLDLYKWIKRKYSNLLVTEPLERGETGHYKVFGEQPEGRMNLPYEEWKEKQDLWYENLRKSLLCDLFIISANAITLQGEIISIDGTGNRVAGMIFGPKHVLCIVGKNKISTNIETAFDRINNYAAPMTYIRHLNKHAASFQNLPCVNNGKCYSCNDESSACRDIIIMRGQIKMHKDRLHLLVVNKNIGF